MVKQIYYYCEACPVSEACSAASWKKAQAWGATEQECRQQVKAHLMHSGLHRLSETDATNLADIATILTYEQEVDEDAEPPAKRKKTGGAAAAAVSQKPAVVAAPGPRPPAYPPAIGMGPSSSSVGLTTAEYRGSLIYMRTTEFQAAIDCTARALHAAQQAHRLALAAGRAFSDEVAALQAVHTNLVAIRESADIRREG